MQTWIFDEKEHKLSCGSEIVQLTPKAAAVLECILRHKGEIVSKELILEEVWPNLHVTEDLVREYIFDIRTALGDNARSPDYIETLRGRGFRVVGDLSFGEPARVEPTTELPQQSAKKPAICVLRPTIVGDGQNPEGFGDSLAGLIIGGLVAQRGINVVSRQSSFAVDPSDDLRRVAKQLSSEYLLESSVDLSDQTVQAVFILVDGKTGHNVWARRFDVPEITRSSSANLLANQVVNTLTGWHGELHLAEFKLVSRKNSENLSAFEHFVRGCDLELRFDSESVQHSLEHLEKSLELDPDFARCWVVKSLMLQWSFNALSEKKREILEKSAHAMSKAFMLDPGDPLTLSLIALQRAREGDFSGSRNALDQAVAGCVDDADACVCVATSLCVLSGEFEQSREMFNTATKINPVYPGWYRFVEARIAFYFEEYERSISSSISGPQGASAGIYRCLSQTMLGQIEAARISYKDLLERYPGFDFEFYADNFPISDSDARMHYNNAVIRFFDEL